MRSFRHWTPRYIWNRLAEIRYRRLNPELPWLTQQANRMLTTMIRDSDVGLEFGSGRSTLWFAKRLSFLTSVEHDESWYERVQKMMSKQGVSNVAYVYAPEDAPEYQGTRSTYVRVVDRFDEESLDFVLVDGAYRAFCALEVLSKLKHGGILVVDNANWFLPSSSYSPASRSVDQGPKGDVWDAVLDRTSSWRQIWTSNGVTDTALFVRC